MGKSFRKNRQNQGENENGQEYDPEIENFDTLKINKGINDPQYNSVLKNSHRPKKKSNSYFQTASQYQGTNIQPESEQQNDGDSQEILNDGIKMAVTQIKNERKNRSKLLEEDFQAIDQEDQAHLIEMKKQNDMEGNPEHLKNQLIYFSKLIQIRQHSHQNLQQLKKFPSKNQPVCRSLAQKTKNLETNIISNIQFLIRNYWKVARQLFDFESEDTITENTIDDLLNSAQRSQYKTDVCNLYEQFQNESKFIDKEVEDELIRLSQKTALLKNSNKSQYNSLIMQTPIGQTKKIMKDWKRVSNRSQQKRAVFKTLFEPEQNIRQNTNPQIFDDFQFYQQISKVYEKEMCEDQNQFRVSDTMKHLKQRELRLENRIKKDVDRKASKSRKIRYNIHTKLLNFMPCKMDQTIQARDDIVKNLFNSAIGSIDEEIDYIDI